MFVFMNNKLRLQLFLCHWLLPNIGAKHFLHVVCYFIKWSSINNKWRATFVEKTAGPDLEQLTAAAIGQFGQGSYMAYGCVTGRLPFLPMFWHLPLLTWFVHLLLHENFGRKSYFPIGCRVWEHSRTYVENSWPYKEICKCYLLKHVWFVSMQNGGGILCFAHCTLYNGFAVHLKAEPITRSSVDLLIIGW